MLTDVLRRPVVLVIVLLVRYARDVRDALGLLKLLEGRPIIRDH